MSQYWFVENVTQQITFAFLESKSPNKFEKSNYPYSDFWSFRIAGNIQF
jgi:hypothetical protein